MAAVRANAVDRFKAKNKKLKIAIHTQKTAMLTKNKTSFRLVSV